MVKLLLQAGVALTAVAGLGFGIESLHLKVLDVQDLGLMALPISVVWIVGTQNTVNLIDGLDGLGGIVALALTIADASRPDQPNQLLVTVLSAALAGACLGFLLFNFHPAAFSWGTRAASS